MKKASLITIKILMGIVSLVCIILSFTFTQTWFNQWHNIFYASIFSLAMIIFSTLSFEVIIFSWKDYKPVSIVFTFLFLIAFLISSYSTIETLYEARLDNIIEYKDETKVSEKEQLAWEIILEEEKQYKQEYETHKKEYDRLQNDMKNMTEKDKLYWTKFWERSEAEKKMNAAKEKLDTIRNDKKKFLEKSETGLTEETEITKETFSMMLNRTLIKLPPDLIDFIVSLFPAIFIDIMAPLALAVTMFLNPKEEKVEIPEVNHSQPNKELVNYIQNIATFADRAWYNIYASKNKKKYLSNIIYITNDGKIMDKKIANKILNYAVQIGLLIKKGHEYYPTVKKNQFITKMVEQKVL